MMSPEGVELLDLLPGGSTQSQFWAPIDTGGSNMATSEKVCGEARTRSLRGQQPRDRRLEQLAGRLEGHTFMFWD